MTEQELLELIEKAHQEDWRELNLYKCGLKELPVEIKKLTKLSTLYLHRNNLQTLPPEIGDLANLEVLYLGGNQLKYLPGEIGRLKNLIELSLAQNELECLPPDIGHLTHLVELDASENHLRTIPSTIGQLKNLEFLSLSENEIVSLPSEIGDIEHLQELFLTHNRLTELPRELGQLHHLTSLNIFGNEIENLPLELGQLTTLSQLDLYGNPLKNIPVSIKDQGARAVIAFLSNQSISTQKQWLSKLLLVGEGGVGKTSLVNSLQNKPFDLNESTTQGIEVTRLELTHPSYQNVLMQLNTWDFGGQEIYHATHQFFLTNRSLFLVVWNARSGWKQGNLYRWLDVIQSRAPESPIIVVATNIDERDAILSTQELQKNYPQIVTFCSVSNKTDVGIPDLRRKLAEVAASLPLMGESWPKTWLKAATAVREHPDRYTTPQQITALMAAHSVTGDNVHILVRWLHELGDILYYEEDEQLNDLVILKPQWVTKHISDVLSSEKIVGSLGIFSRAHMNMLWSELPSDLRDHFLRLMERFDLSYRIPEHQDISLVVERLPLDPPAYQPAWNAILDRQPCQEMTMRFRLNTIPPGVPTWFIARQHRFTTYTHWRSGVLFAQDNRDPYQAQHLALVMANAHDRTVTLTVRGPYPHNFFALLKDGLELTLARFPGLKIERLMPCPTPGCAHQFNYEDLQRRLSKKPVIECPKCWQDISVPQLLFGIDWRTQDAVIERLNTLVSGQQEILKETRQLKELTDREFLALFKREQRLIESHCPNVFLLYPVQTEWYKKPFTKQKMGLHLCCQAPNEWHYTYHGYERTGYYEFEIAADWLVKMAPYLKMLFRLVQLATPFFHASFGVSRADMEQEWGHHVDLMNSLLTHLPAMDGAEFDDMEGLDRLAEDSQHGLRFEASGAALRQIRALLDEQDPAREWGGLRKVLTPEGHYLWLCEYHAAQYRG